MIIEAAKGGHTNVVKLLLEWPGRLLLNSSIDLAQPDQPHVSLAQGAVEEVCTCLNIFVLFFVFRLVDRMLNFIFL
jgi:hypothetical protein